MTPEGAMFGIPDDVDSVAHVIQIALTPVFLLTGIASLLSVLSARLARVADRVDQAAEKMDSAGTAERRRLRARLAYLRRRSHTLDIAVMLATVGGVAASLAVLLLFVGTLRERAGVSLFVAFGMALVCTVGALSAFLIEMLMASRGIRVQAADADEAPEAPEPFHETTAHAESGQADPGSVVE